MAFNMKKCSIVVDNTPIYQKDMDEGVMGQANKNGSIILNKNLSPLEQEDVIKHEKVHLNQMERGDLDYDDDNVIWKGKKFSRAKMAEGAKNLPWEAEAYKKEKNA